MKPNIVEMSLHDKLARIPWDKMSDTQVCEKLGIYPALVSSYRLLHNIPTSRKRGAIPYETHEELRDAPWGEKTDKDICKMFGLHLVTIAKFRNRNGILPARIHKNRSSLFLPKNLPLFEKTKDVDLADRVGLSRERVRQIRKSLGLPSSAGIYKKSVRFRNWTKAELAMLGKFPDRVVAREIGISCSTVRNKRLLLGIKGYKNPSMWDDVDWSMRSRDIAEKLGVFPESVSGARRKYAPHTLKNTKNKMVGK